MIEKGEEWGVAGQLPSEAPIAGSDAQAASYVGRHEIIGLDAGDLARTLGVRKPTDRTSPKQLLPIDVLTIELDSGEIHSCIAHAVVGHPLVDEHVVAVMNAAFIQKRNIAPRAHPGDGKADVVTLRLKLGDRLKAWQRMTTGSHLPHPGIEVRRVNADVLDFGSKKAVRIDGRRVGRSSTLGFTVVPNSITVAV